MNAVCGEPLTGMGISCQLPRGHPDNHRATIGGGVATRIDAGTAKAAFPKFDRSNVFLFDPDEPKEDPNDLLNRVHGGRMLDPRAMNHNCPFCGKTMAWDLFVAHAEACFRTWRKATYRARRKIGTVIS